MNILIICTNTYQSPVPVMPIGACMVAEALERSGHNISFLDLMFVRNPALALESIIDETNPEVVGLSIRNIDNNEMQHPKEFFWELIPLVNIIRMKTNANIIIGGAAVGVMPEALLRFTGAEWAVLGDGEVVFPRLLTALSHGNEPHQVPGIAWLYDSVFKINQNYAERFSDDYEFPDLREWLNLRRYRAMLSTVPVQTKLGCHFQCVYCTYRKIEGSHYRLCDVNNVVREIKQLVYNGWKDIEFVDNVFNYPYEHALNLCTALARSKTNARLQSLELNPLFIDDKLMKAMENAGFVGIGITVESASDTVLHSLKKGFTSAEVYHAAEVINRYHTPCLWIFMFGGPGETRETVEETLLFAEKYLRPNDVVFFHLGIRIYPGTELECIARNEGLLEKTSDEMLHTVFYFSPKLDLEWTKQRIQKSITRHANFINSKAISLPLLSTLNCLGSKIGAKPPLWKHTPLIRRGLRIFGADI